MEYILPFLLCAGAGKLLVSEFKTTHKSAGQGNGKNLDRKGKLKYYRSFKYIICEIYIYNNNDLLQQYVEGVGRAQVCRLSGRSSGM